MRLVKRYVTGIVERRRRSRIFCFAFFVFIYYACDVGCGEGKGWRQKKERSCGTVPFFFDWIVVCWSMLLLLLLMRNQAIETEIEPAIISRCGDDFVFRERN